MRFISLIGVSTFTVLLFCGCFLEYDLPGGAKLDCSKSACPEGLICDPVEKLCRTKEALEEAKKEREESKKKELGTACGKAEECKSGQCVDGVCCDGACGGVCEACNLEESRGECKAVPKGEDPANECPVQEPSTCGYTGFCDGRRGCEKWPEGTECGHGKFCQLGVCSMKANGAACSSGEECQTGICADGVCCNTACDKVCQACNVKGHIGECAMIPEGEDPDDECRTDSPESCGFEGSCNGRGACEYYDEETLCSHSSCEEGVMRLAGYCDGKGNCRGSATKKCDPYVCSGPSECFNACSSDEHCIKGVVCVSNSCGEKMPQGAECFNNHQCGTGFCVDNVCCESACDGVCMTCKLSGYEGVCMPIPAGRDPDDDCPLESPATCGLDGMCDGYGGCRLHDENTECAKQSCKDGVLTTGAKCDGIGNCGEGEEYFCEPYTCDGNNCRNSCTNNYHCVSPAECISGSCQGKLANGEACARNSDCSSGFCISNICCEKGCKNGTCQEATGACVCNYLECGGSCCAEGQRCFLGSCCTPKTCVGQGYQCGVHDDGCGGTMDCSSPGCTGCNSECDPTGYCKPASHHHYACSGSHVYWYNSCGALEDRKETCGEGSVCFNKECCQVNTCQAAEKNCGEINDGCGGYINCGSCSPPNTCGGGGVENVCGCTKKDCETLGAECGSVSDECGGTINCGSCSGNAICGTGSYGIPKNKCGVPECRTGCQTYQSVYICCENGVWNGGGCWDMCYYAECTVGGVSAGERCLPWW